MIFFDIGFMICVVPLPSFGGDAINVSVGVRVKTQTHSFKIMFSNLHAERHIGWMSLQCLSSAKERDGNQKVRRKDAINCITQTQSQSRKDAIN